MNVGNIKALQHKTVISAKYSTKIIKNFFLARPFVMSSLIIEKTLKNPIKIGKNTKNHLQKKHTFAIIFLMFCEKQKSGM